MDSKLETVKNSRYFLLNYRNNYNFVLNTKIYILYNPRLLAHKCSILFFELLVWFQWGNCLRPWHMMLLICIKIRILFTLFAELKIKIHYDSEDRMEMQWQYKVWNVLICLYTFGARVSMGGGSSQLASCGVHSSQ